MSAKQSPDQPGVLDWRQALRQHVSSSLHENEGLRERKKRLTRQQISDTATLMFLELGFDHVKITDVAEACGVSEKTVYNYFATKESLVLDQEDEMSEAIRDALGPNAGRRSPVDAMIAIIKAKLNEVVSSTHDAGLETMGMIRGFADMVDQTPSLKAAQMDMTERLAQEAARAMAVRAGVDPDDPEPQIAADALLGLWRVYFRASVKYADQGVSLDNYERLVLNDVERAARLLETGLWSFNAAVQGTNSREQMKAASEASNEARKQVIVAIMQAKDAWHQVKSDVTTKLIDDRDDFKRSREAQKENVRRAHEQLRRDGRKLRDTALRAKREAQVARQEVREELVKQLKDVRPRTRG
jgi:AcrR family transcriptional regulator